MLVERNWSNSESEIASFPAAVASGFGIVVSCLATLLVVMNPLFSESKDLKERSISDEKLVPPPMRSSSLDQDTISLNTLASRSLRKARKDDRRVSESAIFLLARRFPPDPGILQHLLGRHPCFGVAVEQPFDAVDGGRGQVRREPIVAELQFIFFGDDPSGDGGVVGPPLQIVGVRADQHDVENDTHGPHVGGLVPVVPVGVVGIQRLRRAVPQRPHAASVVGAHVVPPHHVRTPEVHDLDGRVPSPGAEHQVLGLEVVVPHPDPVQETQRRRDLPHQPRRVRLRVRPRPDQVVEHLPAAHEVQHQAVVARRADPLEVLAEAAHVRVSAGAAEVEQRRDLPPEGRVVRRRRGNFLEGEFLARLSVGGEVHGPERALAEGRAQVDVVAVVEGIHRAVRLHLANGPVPRQLEEKFVHHGRG
mmetsp:Transcript_13196/g.26330  ORF Transcript_13196/g.26330 Transcript_13196/m.26330 type:complete len:420 (+) Transcript_13196:954-2213(+)